MPGTNNFLQWNPSQTNQENDAAYLADAQRVGGAPTGNVFPSLTGNKLFYQVSTFVAAFAQMMATKNYNMQDGNLSTLASILSAVLTNNDLRAEIQFVTWSSTVNLDCSKYNGFEIPLNGNTVLNISGFVPGQFIRFIFAQDATGGRTVTFPGTWSGSWQPDPTPNSISDYTVEVDASGTSFFPMSPVVSDIGIISTPINQRGTPAAARFPTVSVGDNSTSAATTAWVRAFLSSLGIAFSLGSTSGYIKFGSLFGNAILQYVTGSSQSVSPGPFTVNFAIPFPTSCLSANVGTLSSSTDDTKMPIFTLISKSTTGVSVAMQRVPDHGYDPASPVVWALGN